MKRRKGCWTCTARKIHCDGRTPTCANCSVARRRCQGYEMRLSWPKPGDTKRMTVGNRVSPKGAPPNSHSRMFFINTAWHEADLHARSARRVRTCLPIPVFRSVWQRHGLPACQVELIDHFYSVAHWSLNTFGVATSELRDVLLSMASQGGTPSAHALLYALLAFSALHRRGPCEQAIQLKILALQYLSSSLSEGSLGLIKASQHVAASMLLGAFEILLPSDSSGDWVWHIWGAMDSLEANHLTTYMHERSTARLIDWVYYHNALSRFAIRHWHNKPSHGKMLETPEFGLKSLQCSPLSRYKPLPPSPNPTFAILNLLTEVIDTLVDPWDVRSREGAYLEQVQILQAKLKEISPKADLTKSEADATLAVDLYQAATQIYLARASQSPFDQPAELDAVIDAAYNGPIKNCVCEHFFPLLIIACEARRDEQRIAILNLLERVRRDARIRSVQVVQNIIQSIWVQQDLNADTEVLMNYTGLMSAAISSSSTVQSFV